MSDIFSFIQYKQIRKKITNMLNVTSLNSKLLFFVIFFEFYEFVLLFPCPLQGDVSGLLFNISCTYSQLVKWDHSGLSG